MHAPPTVGLTRKFSPQSVYEPIWFGVQISLQADESFDSSAHALGMAIARKVIEIGAKPLLSAMTPRAIRKGASEAETFDIESVVIPVRKIEIPEGLRIASLNLEFGQTWQLTKPYASSVSPSANLPVELGGRAFDNAVAEGWEELIVGIYLSVEDLLVAGGRWDQKMSDLEKVA